MIMYTDFWNKIVCTLMILFFSTFLFSQNDVALNKVVNIDSVGLGDTVTFTITIYNTNLTDITGLEVFDSLSPSLSFLDATVPGTTTFSAGTGVWDIGSELDMSTDSLVLSLRAIVSSEGIHFNYAEVSAMDQTDGDSVPDNQNFSEDDMATACVSVPIRICTTLKDTILLEAPAGLDNYQWFKDGATQVSTDSIYAATEPGRYTFIGDQNSCNFEYCCPVILEEICFDLALNKKLASGQSLYAKSGDTIQYEITIFNQGDIAADSILITDYIPSDMTLIDDNWAGNDTLLTIAQGSLSAGGLVPGDSIKLSLSLEINNNVTVDSIINYSEISYAIDITEIDNRDKDSAADSDDSNDRGGASGSAADDVITGDGTGAIGDGVSSTDEDDHDPEAIFLCPIISATPVNPTTCNGNDGEIDFTFSHVPDGIYTINYIDGAMVAQSFSNVNVSGNAATVSGLSEESYNDMTITNGGCTSNTVSVTLTDPTTPTLVLGTLTNPTTCNGTDGAIQLSGLNSNTNYDLNFDKGGVAQASQAINTDGSGNYSMTGLDADTYDNINVT
ncbi:MAG: DUF11 domain-containing protein, partial [Bacteroidetes bacterium]|nr:DUF11 domain-containing protein [Bacteroidota bacterium]